MTFMFLISILIPNILTIYYRSI